MDITEASELIRVVISLVFLAVASFFDYKTRSLPDIIFIVFMPIAGTLTVVGILFTNDPITSLINFALFVTITTAIFLIIGRIGFFGEADTLIMISLSLAIPWPPLSNIKPILGANTVLPILSISIFDNALLASVLTLPYAFISNMIWKFRTGKRLFEGFEGESYMKKLGAVLFCIKKEKPRVKSYDMISEEDGKLTLFNKVQEEDLSHEELQELPENVFVSFAIPMVIFIFIGFITAIFFGDFIIFIIKNIIQF